MNPNAPDTTRTIESRTPTGLEAATVHRVYNTDGTSDSNHVLEVEPDFHAVHVPAEMVVSTKGSVNMPNEGDRVLISHYQNGRAQVLGSRYTLQESVPEAAEGERVIGHPASDSRIHFADDGTITVTTDSGNTVTVSTDGTMTLNGGTVAPVTDVSTTTDSDGHVTDVSITRASDLRLNE